MEVPFRNCLAFGGKTFRGMWRAGPKLQTVWKQAGNYMLRGWGFLRAKTAGSRSFYAKRTALLGHGSGVKSGISLHNRVNP